VIHFGSTRFLQLLKGSERLPEMTTINLAVTVELSGDLTADEVSALVSDLIFGMSRPVRREVVSAIRNGQNPGLTATVGIKHVEDETVDEDSEPEV
jgi:hypothetical protein